VIVNGQPHALAFFFLWGVRGEFGIRLSKFSQRWCLKFCYYEMLHCVAGNLTYTDLSNIRGAFVIKYW
jgi:hypothetical protein